MTVGATMFTATVGANAEVARRQHRDRGRQPDQRGSPVQAPLRVLQHAVDGEHRRRGAMSELPMKLATGFASTIPSVKARPAA